MKTAIFTPRKRFGQNFLKAKSYLHRIVQSLSLSLQDELVEIGPGLGALTEPLLAYVPTLSAIEIDKDLIEQLKQRWPSSQLNLVEGDALKFDFKKLALQKQRALRIVGNLPYNVATPLLFHFMSAAPYIQDIHIMVQKEVADRLIAAVGEQSYSRLSVMMQYYCQTKLLFKVPPGAFWPIPKVYSAFVRLRPYSETSPCFRCCSMAIFAQIVKAAFNQKRKTLRNALREWVTLAQWEALEIHPSRRAETVSVAEYVKIANSVVQIA